MTENEILEACYRAGFELAGFASALGPWASAEPYEAWLETGFDASMSYLRAHSEAKSDLNRVLPGVQSALVVGKYYSPVRLDDPKIARYALNRDYHHSLRAKLRPILKLLQTAYPDDQFRICIDSAPVFERELAHRAGLGWPGKNTMLIDSKRGSWFMIASILSTRGFEPSLPSQGGCGTCQACIDACPTGAIVELGGRWQVDSRQCISFWTIEHEDDFPSETPQLDDWIFGCDVCQEVCPFNQPRESQPLRASFDGDPNFWPPRPWPAASELAHLDEEIWEQLSPGSPLRRAGLEGIRRNAKQSTNVKKS